LSNPEDFRINDVSYLYLRDVASPEIYKSTSLRVGSVNKEPDYIRTSNLSGFQRFVLLTDPGTALA